MLRSFPDTARNREDIFLPLPFGPSFISLLEQLRPKATGRGGARRAATAPMLGAQEWGLKPGGRGWWLCPALTVEVPGGWIFMFRREHGRAPETSQGSRENRRRIPPGGQGHPRAALTPPLEICHMPEPRGPGQCSHHPPTLAQNYRSTNHSESLRCFQEV